MNKIGMRQKHEQQGVLKSAAPDQDITQADLSAAQLEKLREEIKELQDKSRSSLRLDRYIPIITLIFTLAGILVGITEFRATLRENQKQFVANLDAALTRDRSARIHDYAKDYAVTRSTTYLDAIKAAALIANLPPWRTRSLWPSGV